MTIRVAVVDRTSCKPDKCSLECVRFCPINRAKRKAIELAEDGKHVVIHEDVCVGCGICVKKCPFSAISIVNLPSEIEENLVHRYGPNMFKLYGLPALSRGYVVGLIGRNGSGKTTALRILSGQLVPNLGNYDNPPSWEEVLRRFRGTEIQAYLGKLSNGEVRAVVKPQYVEAARRVLRGAVGELLKKVDERGILKDVVEMLDLARVLDHEVRALSGGELQRFLIAATLLKDADAYFFDEPCSYLDVRERIRAARAIREFAGSSGKYVLVVEHDLMALDYLSDYVAVIYGEPGTFGVVSKTYGVRVGINHYLDGYLPAENMRIREEPLRFKPVKAERASGSDVPVVAWDRTLVKYEETGFTLEADEGYLSARSVLTLIGPNGIGKTTFIRALLGEIKPASGGPLITVEKISYKPQEVSPQLFGDGRVLDVLRNASAEAVDPSSWIYAELVRKLSLNKLFERTARELSGGELQKLAVAVTLARDADVYVLDEPSAYLDVEERISVARAIRRIVEERGKAAIVIEHDLLFVNYVSDRVMLFRGEPSVRGFALKPMDVERGLNELLKDLSITVRRDKETLRPRVNKPGSALDREQRSQGLYYAMA
ncbi:MAG: ribosome biogenesis/translation initiation ATPase RLI [Desulfurococcaceae archaeon]